MNEITRKGARNLVLVAGETFSHLREDLLQRCMDFRVYLGTWKLEVNDVRALITLVNVICIISFGFSVSWLGLAVAVLGLVKDFTVDRKFSGIILHLSNAVLNIYFLVQAA